MNANLIATIDALLPQTQCGKCGHSGCLPYAEEISAGGAINKCPPGGSSTIAQLAGLLHRDIIPLNPENGIESERLVAYIREDECIGCTKCITACPVDAILGASKRMHTVIIDECTGCDLCVAPCPVDCIDLLPAPSQTEDAASRQALSQHWRQRYEFRNERLAKTRAAQIERRKNAAEFATQLLKQEPSKPFETGTWTPPQKAPEIMTQEKAKTDIAAALARNKARKEALKKLS